MYIKQQRHLDKQACCYDYSNVAWDDGVLRMRRTWV